MEACNERLMVFSNCGSAMPAATSKVGVQFCVGVFDACSEVLLGWVPCVPSDERLAWNSVLAREYGDDANALDCVGVGTGTPTYRYGRWLGSNLEFELGLLQYFLLRSRWSGSSRTWDFFPGIFLRGRNSTCSKLFGKSTPKAESYLRSDHHPT